MTYQDLNGGVGRRVFYRPPRHGARALLGQGAAIVRIGNVDARLLDVSITGLACELNGASSELSAGSIHTLQLWIGEERAFAARAQIVRFDPDSSRIGVRFIDAVIEPATLREVERGQRARAAIRDGAEIYERVPRDYRLAIHEVATVLSHWRVFLERREAEISKTAGPAASEQLIQLEELAEKRMRADWFRVHASANESAEELLGSPSVISLAKSLTELLVTPLLLTAPIWERAYRKPRGYPGDFELMNYMYDEARAGASVFARVMHQLGREERLAATVRNRRDFLVRQLREAIRRAVSTGQRELRVCNVGAGPARELEDLLSEVQLPLRLRLWLVDQDEDALSFAYERLCRASLHHGESVEIKCRFASFRQVVTQPELLQELRGQDLVYSAGLMDYLSPAVGEALVAQLWGLLRVGGRLLIGNAADDVGIKWVPEFVLDWRMRYRNEHQMLNLTRRVPGARREVQTDDSKAWHFLVIAADQGVTNE